MTKWWFTSDLHLDHPWIAGWRGFCSVPTMDKHLIDGWNSRVNPGDVVVQLGDLYWSSNTDRLFKILKKLHGNIIHVKGNHDYWVRKLKPNFRRIYQRMIDQNYFVCCHYPMWSWNRKDYGAIHLHGHSHGKTLPRVNMLDVGVDSAKTLLGDYVPFSMEEVLYLTTTTKPEERY